MDSSKKNVFVNTNIEKRSPFKIIFYNYLHFLSRGGKMFFNFCKWTIYNFGMHAVILIGIITN